MDYFSPGLPHLNMYVVLFQSTTGQSQHNMHVEMEHIFLSGWICNVFLFFLLNCASFLSSLRSVIYDFNMSDLKQNKTYSSDSALIKIVDVVLPGYFKQIKFITMFLKKE